MGRRRGSFLFSPRFLSEATDGPLEIVEVLLAAGADVNKEYENGRTVLWWAVKKRKTSRQKNDPVLCVRGSLSE